MNGLYQICRIPQDCAYRAGVHGNEGGDIDLKNRGREVLCLATDTEEYQESK